MGNVVAVAYDYDGVAVNSLPLLYLGICAVCRKSSIKPPTFVEFRRTFAAPFERSYRQLGVTLDSEELWATHNEGVGEYNPPVFKGFRETIEELRRHNTKVIVVSANLKIRIMRSLIDKGLRHFFHHVFCVEDDKTATLRKLPEICRCDPEQILFVGDMTSDMRDGVSSGLYPVGFDYDGSVFDVLTLAGARRVISSHEKILDLL